MVLTDGGVYDNLGLETAWKRYQTVLVSDAGGQLERSRTPSATGPRHACRVLGVIDNQVRALRKRQAIERVQGRRAHGAYWGIRTDIADYGLADAAALPARGDDGAGDAPTRLKRLDDVVQERLINWGYAVCDAALRTHVDPSLRSARRLPVSRGGGRVTLELRQRRARGVSPPRPAHARDTAGLADPARRLDRVRRRSPTGTWTCCSSRTGAGAAGPGARGERTDLTPDREEMKIAYIASVAASSPPADVRGAGVGGPAAHSNWWTVTCLWPAED